MWIDIHVRLTVQRKSLFFKINLFHYEYVHVPMCASVCVCAHGCAVTCRSQASTHNYCASLRHLSPSSISSSETCLSPTSPESLFYGVTCLFLMTLFPSLQSTTHPKIKSLVLLMAISTNKSDFNCMDITF